MVRRTTRRAGLPPRGSRHGRSRQRRRPRAGRGTGCCGENQRRQRRRRGGAGVEVCLALRSHLPKSGRRVERKGGTRERFCEANPGGGQASSGRAFSVPRAQGGERYVWVQGASACRPSTPRRSEALTQAHGGGTSRCAAVRSLPFGRCVPARRGRYSAAHRG